MPNFLSLVRSKIPRHFTQVMTTLAVSLGPLSAGLGKGYSSPALSSLQESKTSSFHVSAQEGSWVASLSLLGALFGCLVGGLMLQVGRKRTLLYVALPFSGSWLLTVFAQRVEMMYCTSFIGGFLSAVTLLATQVYVSEIAHPEIRGCLSAVLKMAGEIGTLSSFSLGAFLDWRELATFAAGGPILFFFAILLIPETPSFLLYHGREEEARKAMTWLRSSKDDVASEMETLRSNISTKHKSFFPRCSSQFPFRQLFITCGLMFFQKFSGVTVFHHYAVPIFKQVFGRSIDAHWAAIVVVLLRLLGSMTSGLLIDTAGRLPLLIISNLFISASFFGFGLYNYMEESLPPNYPGFGPSLDWIPLTCVLFFTLFFSIGIGPISWLMVGELFPLEYRGFGAAVSTSFSYACAFAAVKTYVDIRSSVGLYGAFWIYSAISIAGLFFVCCLVPETKGVQLEEMYHGNAPQNTPKPSQETPPTASNCCDSSNHDTQKGNPSNKFTSICHQRELVADTVAYAYSAIPLQSACGRMHVVVPPCSPASVVEKKCPKTLCLNLATSVSDYEPIRKLRSKSCNVSVPKEYNNVLCPPHEYKMLCNVPCNHSKIVSEVPSTRRTITEHSPHLLLPHYKAYQPRPSNFSLYHCTADLYLSRDQIQQKNLGIELRAAPLPSTYYYHQGATMLHQNGDEISRQLHNGTTPNNFNTMIDSNLATVGSSHYRRQVKGTIV